MKRFVCLSLLFVVTGCVDQPSLVESPPEKPPKPVESVAPVGDEISKTGDSGTFEKQVYAGLEFSVPEDWKEVPLSDFQRGIISARFQMPEAGAEITLTLSRASGGMESNLNRWRGQFRNSRDEMLDSLTVANEESTMIDLQGSFSPGFGKSADGEWRMIGVIVPLQGQSYFIKLTGPVDQVAAVRDDFMAFVRSATVE